MGRNDGSRFSSMTSSSTDSARSSVTVKPLPSTPSSASATPPNASRSASHGSRRAAPSRLKTDDNIQLTRPFKDSESQISPTSASGSRLALSPSSTASNSSHTNRMSDFAGYRRDLAILDSSGGRSRDNHQTNPASGSLTHQIAPWMSATGGSTAGSSTFFNDSTDNLSITSQLSPGIRGLTARPSQSQTTAGSNESPDLAYFTDERRPSIASITTTASSQGSRASGARGGLRKLQGFFGEEFPGRDSSETSLIQPSGAKDHRQHSHSSRPHRDRNYSNATDHGRDASPSSRPRTPVPAPEVVPFLYQEADDIARFGEAPVRDTLSGPDRERYVNEASQQNPPKTSSSGRSGHSIVHLPGHHRHQKSNDDPRALRPSISREDSTSSYPKDRNNSTAMYGPRSRAQSPTPSGNGSYWGSKLSTPDEKAGSITQKKGGILGRLRGKAHRDKEDSESLRKLTGSSHSLQHRPSKADIYSEKLAPPGDYGFDSRDNRNAYGLRPETGGRQATFNNRFPFAKKGGRSHRHHDDIDEHIGPTDRQDGGGTVYHLDTNLSDMEGILSRPLPLTPMDADFKTRVEPEKVPPKPSGGPPGINGAWNAPDSWAVWRGDDGSSIHVAESDEVGGPPRPEEKQVNYCIRVFRNDGTFATLNMALNATVADVISQIVKKSYVTDGMDNYYIILKKHDLVRVLGAMERPLLMQKRLLQQVGYEDRDRIEEIGREDNSYLCRFLFLSARESDFHTVANDIGFRPQQGKLSHVDLSGRNLITIPVPLYSKASEIISLNLSRNLSLDLPGDFIQACTALRDIKFCNNEARKLPAALSRATRLTLLDVSNNRLEHLDNADLSKITGVLKLNFANNRLTRLPSYLGTFRALRTLNISSNLLDTFPDFLCDLQGLVDLDLSFNLITSFPECIGSLRILERFIITNNRLAGPLPRDFAKLTSLRELDVKYNNITGIDVLSELPKLEMFSADHNQISQFSGTFERIRSLKLNSNPVSKFELKAPVPTLKILNLSGCQLASIDESFNNMMSLERLVLDKNYFVSLPNTIGNLKRLETFSIAHNTVSELPPEIGCLVELRTLDVRGNNIRKLPMELWWACKLQTLNASSNVLDTFPKPASRPPQPPADPNSSTSTLNGTNGYSENLSQTPSAEELSMDPSRRPSQASSTLLSVGPSPVPGGPDRKNSMVSVYGKGGRKTSVISRSTTASSTAGMSSSNLTWRKDSSLSQKLVNTFAGSLRNLYLADNRLDDDIFDQLTHLPELRVLNLSYNDLSDMPQRSIKCWSQLVELYLSGNELSSLPADDLEEYSLLQTLHINSNKFTNLPADISRAKKLAVLDCGSNSLKYNIANVPYDWNWNLNPNLRYLNLSGNRRLEIKQTYPSTAAQSREQLTDFNRLLNLRVLGLMDVTLTQPSIPDQSEDRRVRTSGSLAGYLPYGMADTLGKNEHLSTIDLVVPRFNSVETETLLGLFDGQALSSGGSKIAKYLHENFGHIFSMELKALKHKLNETPEDALRRAFLALNKDLVTVAIQHTEERPVMSHRGSTAPPVVLSKEDLNSGGVATVAYLQGQELYVANVGDIQAMILSSDGSHRMLTKKHDPADSHERRRIRDAGGWVSRNGRLNDLLEVSRAFGYLDLMPAVQAAPHVTHTTVREQDDTVLIATRELWEYLHPGLIADITRSMRHDLMRAAQKLRDIAMAYGSTNKIMVMMISVANLKQRNERTRMHRGQSMSWFSLPQDELNAQALRKARKAKGDAPLDSVLSRLEAEVPAPTGLISIVFTDIKNSTQLWETYPEAMRSAIKLHNEVMRRQLRRIGGFEVKTEGDAFMVSFPTATSALLWCFAVQNSLLTVNWPTEMLNSVSCQAVYDRDNKLIFKGLSVRMGIHWGEPLAEPDPVTRRMDYYGPMVNKASRISAVADGGQIAVSSDFISEIQRCLETYQESSNLGDDSLEDDNFAKAIRSELRSLSSQGFEVKDMGEKKLKGLENPEFVYSLYPHALAGRIEQHTAHERSQAAAAFVTQDKPAVLSPGSELSINPEDIWALWRVALRLEMICSTLEEYGGRGLQPPETELLDRMKQRGGEVTERFLVNFMEHQVSRIETCITTLAMRHIAIGGGPIAHLSDLRAPMTDILKSFTAQLKELQQYKQKYGASSNGRVEEVSDTGSDTEQE
ncbi:protein phosphatase 2C [Cercophora newfieldiana]|uniref:Adenylate cyclase n=1 Tax=Cercophora newfieldiana TaxID=92897 RepID=A0AA39YTJ7_9PEZI|nr:protein phosphatase 2C [Cercophora newfieldiana]